MRLFVNQRGVLVTLAVLGILTFARGGVATLGAGAAHAATERAAPSVSPVRAAASQTVLATGTPACIIYQLVCTSGPQLAAIGSQIADAARVYATDASGNAVSPSGTVTFNLYAPGDTGCAQPVLTSATTLGFRGAAVSAPFANGGAGADELGTYRWTASYYDPSGLLPDAFDGCGAELVQTVDARILLAPATATVVTGQRLTFTALVQTSADEVTWTAVPGATINWTLTDAGGATACFASAAPPHCGKPPWPATASCITDPTGQCSQTIDSMKAGTVTIHAGSSFTQTGVAGFFTRSTGDGIGQDGADAIATYVRPGPHDPPGPAGR